MTLRVEIDRLRLTGIDLAPRAAEQLRGEMEQAIAAELDAGGPIEPPVAQRRVAAAVDRVVAASVERSAG